VFGVGKDLQFDQGSGHRPRRHCVDELDRVPRDDLVSLMQKAVRRRSLRTGRSNREAKYALKVRHRRDDHCLRLSQVLRPGGHVGVRQARATEQKVF
jgi:hypothetical protein